MVQYEYRYIVALTMPDLIEKANRYGAERWRTVAVVVHGSAIIGVLERVLPISQ